MGYKGNNLLIKFIDSENESFNTIYDTIKFFAIKYRGSLEFLKDELPYVELEDINFKYVFNVTIKENLVKFNVIVEGDFVYRTHGKRYDDIDYDQGYQWFNLHCEMSITDKLENFKILNIDFYAKEKQKGLQYRATADLVPIISKKDFDEEATKFLEKWCPQALREPICLPIKNIVEKSMGLTIIDDVQLTSDLSIFGQICFASGEINVFNKDNNSLVKMSVNRGTILIDPSVYFLRCLGCANNTIAHEAFHWERHRIYATVRSILTKQQIIAQRCPIAPVGNLVRDTLSNEEDWMEWQANGIAPRILMPKQMTEKKIKELVEKYNYIPTTLNSYEVLMKIINELAEFYKVSKQSAKIRMIELGYPEATDVYNYDNDCLYYSKQISFSDMISEYKNNKEFKTLFEMELFRNVEGYFIINTPDYWEYTKKGEYKLTDYAKKNLHECSLSFEYNMVELFEFNRERGILYKGKRKPRTTRIFSPIYNQASIDKALEVVPIYQKQIEAAKEFGDETMAQMLVRFMKQKHWQSSIFQEKTGLTSSTYRKIVNTPHCKLELPILVSICVGLGLPPAHARELLNKGGHIFGKTNPEDIAYDAIISGAVSDNILSCNAFIDEIEKKNAGSKIRRLGSIFYNDKKDLAQ